MAFIYNYISDFQCVTYSCLSLEVLVVVLVVTAVVALAEVGLVITRHQLRKKNFRQF